MRIWHKDLIKVLPRQQLLGQWRECCLIAKNISENGTPNHILVNQIITYAPSHFYTYAKHVEIEMKRRGYKADIAKIDKYIKAHYVWGDDLFSCWHNKRYLRQCLCNLQEKYDCGGISTEEWARICEAFPEETKYIGG